ncbi:MAG TPA: NAD(P)-dependent oxidoreductase [Gemmataceae bacterium]
MFPLILTRPDLLAVVVGGGEVGRRKARAALDGGLRVRVVSPGPRPADVPEPAEWLAEPYHPGHLDGAALAFAAATPEVNARVIADARRRGVWVSAADDPAGSDFVLPAVLRRGPLLLAVGTGGAAPALARRVRDKLAGEFDEAFRQWVELLGEMRLLVREQVLDPARRRGLLERLSAWEWLERLRAEGVDAARAAMRGEVTAVVRRSDERL